MLGSCSLEKAQTLLKSGLGGREPLPPSGPPQRISAFGCPQLPCYAAPTTVPLEAGCEVPQDRNLLRRVYLLRTCGILSLPATSKQPWSGYQQKPSRDYTGLSRPFPLLPPDVLKPR